MRWSFGCNGLQIHDLRRFFEALGISRTKLMGVDILVDG
jgi:hypothetical protein